MRGATFWRCYRHEPVCYFNPRSSCEERLGSMASLAITLSYFNPRSSCEERHKRRQNRGRRRYFNPRSSCEERRPAAAAGDGWAKIFQSTLLMRGATPDQALRRTRTMDFNPRSSCEERPEYDLMAEWERTFQSTLLMRGATGRRRPGGRRCEISIHAPHARSDIRAAIYIRVSTISIHAPHARSDAAAAGDGWAKIFQSTLLMRGATPWTL